MPDDKFDPKIMLDTYPTAMEVFGSSWIEKKWSTIQEQLNWYRPWIAQAEKDLSVLKSFLPLSKLRAVYRSGLRDLSQFLQTACEIHGAAFLASIASDIKLHVPKGDGSYKNFDVLAQIQGATVQADAKTRDDTFIFSERFRLKDDQAGITGYWRQRPTLDPHDAAEHGIAVRPPPPGAWHQTLPESTMIKNILLDALAQLPEAGLNVVLLGQKSGDRDDLDRALYGPEFCYLDRNHNTKEVTSRWDRFQNGAFCGGDSGKLFSSLSAVMWFRLMAVDGQFYRGYRLYTNSQAESLVPESVVEALQHQIDAWMVLPPEADTRVFDQE